MLEWVAIPFSPDTYRYIYTHAQAYTHKHSLKLIEEKLLKKKTEYCENINSFQVNI